MTENSDFNDLISNYFKNIQPKPQKVKLSKKEEDTLSRRLEVLLPQFKKAIQRKNLSDARIAMNDLQDVLRKLDKTAKLVECKNQLYELAMESGELSFAITGFQSNRALINSNTRLHLEATALLAIAYLRNKDLEKAKPFIREVLQNKKVIKTESTREKFHKEMIDRFDEECALFSLQSDRKVELDPDQLHTEVVRMLNAMTDEQIFDLLGKSLPRSTKDLMYEVDKFSKNQLTYKEQKLLPPAEDIVKNEQAGKTVFAAFKRVVYKSLCDPNSEVYKAWNSNIAGSVLDKKYITGAVGLALGGSGIGATALIISAAALVLRFGLDIYCERYRPAGVMEFRGKS